MKIGSDNDDDDDNDDNNKRKIKGRRKEVFGQYRRKENPVHKGLSSRPKVKNTISPEFLSFLLNFLLFQL